MINEVEENLIELFCRNESTFRHGRSNGFKCIVKKIKKNAQDGVHIFHM